MRDNVNIFAAIVSVVILLWGIFPNPYIRRRYWPLQPILYVLSRLKRQYRL